MHWTIYAMGSAVFAAMVAIFGKLGLKGVDSTLATTVRSVVMALFLVVLSLSIGKFSSINTVLGSRTLTFIILSGVAGALSWLCYFVAIKEGPVSGVVALDRLSVVFAILLSAIFLSEALTWKTILGSAAIFAGALLIAL